MIETKRDRISIERFKAGDIQIIVNAFQQADWDKPASTFENYLQEQLIGARVVWIAYLNNQFAGYVTLKWQSQYEPFATAGIPEIMEWKIY